MNRLYKQSLQSLPRDDQEMLIVALRWLICSKGKIDSVLITHELEPHYEDVGNLEDEDDFGYEDEIAGVPCGTSEESDGGSDEVERPSIRKLENIGRDFLKFDSQAIDVQHQSVRDFVKNDEKVTASRSKTLSRVSEAYQSRVDLPCWPEIWSSDHG